MIPGRKVRLSGFTRPFPEHTQTRRATRSSSVTRLYYDPLLAATASRKLFSYGARATPRSVMIAET